jgi:hypothetical protein
MRGYKTYLCATAIFIVAGLTYGLHIIPTELGAMLIAFFASLGGMALRAAVKNMNGG